ncbi:MAG: S8 family serine peptidase [Candidatus Poseidoniaceae archaeon]|jgi:hypothetical protein|nr:S8 family serine peptidase [Candidatus Poseidoniaceae archaeon]
MRWVIVGVLLFSIASPVVANRDEIGRDGGDLIFFDDWYLYHQNNSKYNGSGVVVAIADTGVDVDHACFRNQLEEVGDFGSQHRKIIHYNDSIDSGDYQGHTQFKHGTHLAGILACDPIEGGVDMKSISNGAKLLIQDVVGGEGWAVPPVNELLEESFQHGAVINSWSWGDNTVNYTNRSNNIDLWSLENPWSLVFVAPGNNGGMLLEPANARNVVAVSACDSEYNGSMWGASSIGPDVNNRRGVLICAPGEGIVSAKADGLNYSMNNDSYQLTGTSVSTPVAASFAALLQEMIEVEFGFTPSGPLLRALLAMSAENITDMRPDHIQGYGRPLIDNINSEIVVYDSYQTEDWKDVISSRGGKIDQLISNPWNGSNAKGPFLKSGESFHLPVIPKIDEDVIVSMSYNALPLQNGKIDDLRLIVHKPNGDYFVDDVMLSSGYSSMYYGSVSNPYEDGSSNETTVMIRIPSEDLIGVEWLDIEIFAANITQGVNEGFLGVNGDMVGFALSASGVWLGEENSAPQITIISPHPSSNNSDVIEVEWYVNDLEMDRVVVSIKLQNESQTIDLVDCARIVEGVGGGNCTIDLSTDLVVYQLNSENWKIEILAYDDNSSGWTLPMNSSVISSNFTIWWINPQFENNGILPSTPSQSTSGQNRVLMWSVVGIIVGALVAASVAFRRYEKWVFDSPPPPFVEEEE